MNAITEEERSQIKQALQEQWKAHEDEARDLPDKYR